MARVIGMDSDRLDEFRSLLREIGRCGQFIAEHGVEYGSGPLLDDIRRGQQGACFRNAWKLAERNGFAYVEGFASGPDLSPVLHAWCSEPGSHQAIDPTADLDLYLGVEVNLADVTDAMLRTGTHGSILDDWEAGWPLLREPVANRGDDSVSFRVR